MNCKKCNQELPEQGAFCPFCGEPREPEPLEETACVPEEAVEEIPPELTEASAEPVEEEKPKAKPWKWVAIIAGGIVLLGVLAVAILYGLGIDLTPRANDILYKDSYAAGDEAAQKSADKVVATMGDKELTNGELQIYYQNLIYTFYSEYAYYLSYMNLDLSLPLDEQVCGWVEDRTWEQYFLEGALANWQSYTLTEILAEQNGFVLSQQLQDDLAGIPDDMTAAAEAYGYSSAEDYIHENVGINVSVADYIRFNQVYYTCNEYLGEFYENDYPTAEEVDAYYAENEATFTESGVTRDLGLMSDVRHILISFEGGTENEDGTVTYSQEEKDAALAEAERILQEWKDGAATEESFAELANTYSTDPGSNTNGGLYTDINIDQSYVVNFLNWAIDSARAPGDTGIVETEYGYHIMYFVEGQEYWQYLVAEEVIAERIQQILLAAREEYPARINYKKICLAEVDLV